MAGEPPPAPSIIFAISSKSADSAAGVTTTSKMLLPKSSLEPAVDGGEIGKIPDPTTGWLTVAGTPSAAVAAGGTIGDVVPTVCALALLRMFNG